MKIRKTVVPLAAFLILTSGCSSTTGPSQDPSSLQSESTPSSVATAQASPSSEVTQPKTVEPSKSETSGGTKNYFGNFSITDKAFGTVTSAVLSGSSRIITTNALPNHETGTFPNSGNPNTIQAQNRRWVLPLNVTYTGVAKSVRETGVAINGVKFEPGTAEVAVCASGERHPIEGLQKVADLGMDFNNAHVQPNGEYHYHGKSDLLVALFEQDSSDLVHIGFAKDGGAIYYSKSGKYSSSYSLGTGDRAGESCSYTAGKRATINFGKIKDGSLTTDWQFNKGQGNLDQCNGTNINGKYSYLITDEYPFVPRCLMGEFTENSR